MKFHHLSFFLILSSFTALTPLPTVQFPNPNDSHTRRILHQPLFPASSAPPPATPPPPQPEETPSSPDIPFFNEYPAAPPPPDLNLSPPSTSNNTTANYPTATQPTKPTKKVAIAISVTIVTVGMFSAFGFFLYKHRAKHHAETQKLVSGGNSRRVLEDSPRAPPPSSFLYIGTVEPSRTSVSEANGADRSPYHKLNSVKLNSDHRYRPSPELQPLPRLSKPPADETQSPPAASSSSSSSDEESRETAFHSPHGSSSLSHEDSYYTPVSRLANGSPAAPAVAAPVVPFSKRTSPKSRFSASSPDIRHVIMPASKRNSRC